MADMLLHDTRDIRLMPMRGIAFYAGGEFTSAVRLEKQSNWDMVSIVEKDHRGRDVVMGYETTCNAYILYNKLDVLVPRLQSLVNTEFDFQFMLGTMDVPGMAGNEDTPLINANYGIWVECGNRMGMSYSIEQVEYRPMIKIVCQGIVRKPIAIEGVQVAMFSAD